jgi:hypothetical protein
MTVLEYQGWIVGQFVVNVPGVYWVQCNGVHNFYVEKVDASKQSLPYFGNIFTSNDLWSSMALVRYNTLHIVKLQDEGSYLIYFRIRARIDMQFRCTFAAAPKESDSKPQIYKASKPDFMPDIVEGEVLIPTFSVPCKIIFVVHSLILLVLNLSPTKWLSNIKFRAIVESNLPVNIDIRSPWQDTFQDKGSLLPIAPGQLVSIPASIEITPKQSTFDIKTMTGDECVKFSIVVEHGKLINERYYEIVLGILSQRCSARSMDLQ